MPLRVELAELARCKSELRAGEKLLLNGTVYTARDAAHARFLKLMEQGESLPFETKGAVLYYAGPSQTPPGKSIGSCGPTTSARMDPYTLPLLESGIAAVIGKGDRSPRMRAAFQEHEALYFCAIGGAGALYAAHIVSCETIAFPELGCEAVRRLVLKDFPVYCAYDVQGGDLFKKKD